jgi:peptide-methionine (S)-S-oxide reductase
MSIGSPLQAQPRAGHEFATLGGGCFWCLEAVYEKLAGVTDVESGYAGGHVAAPSYEAVCAGDTGHAEVVRIEFDPRTIAYPEILQVFFAIHDPTTVDRQGSDVGSQYRSVIFHYSATQRDQARAAIAAAQAAWGKEVVTQRLAAAEHPFYRAETDHQEYFRHNPAQPYCAHVVAPKVAKFRKLFASRLREHR